MGPISVTAAFCLPECAGKASSIQTGSQPERQEKGSWLQGRGFEADVWGHPSTLHVITNTEAEQDQRKKPESSFFALIHE